jgi:hypothetical protein
LARNTVRKVIRSGAATSHQYNCIKQPMPQLGAYVIRLEKLLEEDWKRPYKRRLTARRLHELLQEHGYKGSYDAVQRFCKKWREKRSKQSCGSYVPLSFSLRRCMPV